MVRTLGAVFGCKCVRTFFRTPRPAKNRTQDLEHYVGVKVVGTSWGIDPSNWSEEKKEKREESQGVGGPYFKYRYPKSGGQVQCLRNLGCCSVRKVFRFQSVHVHKAQMGSWSKWYVCSKHRRNLRVSRIRLFPI